MTEDELTNKLCKYYPCDPYELHYCEKEHTTSSRKCGNHPQYVRCKDYEGEE